MCQIHLYIKDIQRKIVIFKKNNILQYLLIKHLELNRCEKKEYN